MRQIRRCSSVKSTCPDSCNFIRHWFSQRNECLLFQLGLCIRWRNKRRRRREEGKSFGCFFDVCDLPRDLSAVNSDPSGLKYSQRHTNTPHPHFFLLKSELFQDLFIYLHYVLITHDCPTPPSAPWCNRIHIGENPCLRFYPQYQQSNGHGEWQADMA